MKYCPNCGEKIKSNDADVCLNCGKLLNNSNPSVVFGKSKIVAGILGIFLGGFGIHNFYLGYSSKGLTQLLLTTVGWIFLGLGPIIAGIWGFIEGIDILLGNTNDSNGKDLI